MGKIKTVFERELAVRVGGRIRQVRKMQHISQIKLATDIGIRAGPLGWIEKGLHLPSGRVLYRIAKRLNVRIDDFFQEENVWEPDAPTVSDSAPLVLPPLDLPEADAGALKASHIICRSVVDTLLALADLCGAVNVSELPLYVPFTSSESGAEHLGVRVRQNLGIGNAMGYDCLELFENAGLRVVFLDMPEGCESFCGYDHHNRNAFLFINSQLKKQPERQMFRLVFELGRIFWHTRQLYGPAVVPATETGGVAMDEVQFARRFAVCFLMPGNAVQTSVLQLGLQPKEWTWGMLLQLKRRYGVSAQDFALRMQQLGVSWSDRQRKSPGYYLFKSEIEAFRAEHGPAAEPGGSRPQLAMNGRLSELVLQAEQKAGKDQKPVHIIKRALRQNGVRLEG